MFPLVDERRVAIITGGSSGIGLEAGRQLALKHEVPFAWRLEIAPGVAHSNAGLARQAARIASRR